MPKQSNVNKRLKINGEIPYKEQFISIIIVAGIGAVYTLYNGFFVSACIAGAFFIMAMVYILKTKVYYIIDLNKKAVFNNFEFLSFRKVKRLCSLNDVYKIIGYTIYKSQGRGSGYWTFPVALLLKNGNHVIISERFKNRDDGFEKAQKVGKFIDKDVIFPQKGSFTVIEKGYPFPKVYYPSKLSQSTIKTCLEIALIYIVSVGAILAVIYVVNNFILKD